jgi:OOP family OmpA-OmpF porin
MKKNHLKALLLVVLTLFLFSCAKKQVKDEAPKAGQFEPVTFVKQDLSPMVTSGEMGRKVDTLYVILDASHSMTKSYKGKNLPYTKELISRMIQTIPPELEVYGALRTFGHHPEVSRLNTKKWYGTEMLNGSDFMSALDNVTRAGGRSPLHAAIDATTKELEGTDEVVALIVFTDGEFMGTSEHASFQNMKQALGDRICTYLVQIGDHQPAVINFRKIENQDCGYYYTCDAIEPGPAIADLVKKMLMGPDADGDGVADNLDKCPDTPKVAKVDRRGCPLDSDGDGVPDYLDQCPDTPEGVEVDKWGCPLDSDGDGVPDYLDKCPNTPPGVAVDADGCSDMDRVHFDFGKANVKPEYSKLLMTVAEMLKANPDVKMEIQGHTDSIGTEEFNLVLSKQRAVAVRTYLIDQGVNPDQLQTNGFGFSRPIADNDTDEGRAMNRRVEFSVIK